MESPSTLLVPLTRAARHLAESAQRALSTSTQALREKRDELPQTDLARATTQFLDAAQETISAARSAARPYRRQAARALANAEDQVESIGRMLDTGRRRLAPRLGRRSNVMTRHPYAVTFLAVGVGYIAWRQWRRMRAPSEADAVTEVEAADESADKEPATSESDQSRDGGHEP